MTEIPDVMIGVGMYLVGKHKYAFFSTANNQLYTFLLSYFLTYLAGGMGTYFAVRNSRKPIEKPFKDRYVGNT